MSLTLAEAMTNFKLGLANDLRTELIKAAPVDTGFLKNSINVEITDTEIHINMPLYGLFLEYGTGIYGPLGRPITPKEKKALKFKIGGKIVFAKSVKGMTPRPFVRPVFHQKFVDLIIKNGNMHFADVNL